MLQQQRRIDILTSHISGKSKFSFKNQNLLLSHPCSGITYNSHDKRQEESNVLLETQKDTRLLNAISLITSSQLRGSTRSFSVFRKYFLDQCHFTEKQVSILYSLSVISQTFGFFLGHRISRLIGIKNSALLSTLSMTFGMALTGLLLNHQQHQHKGSEKNDGLFPLSTLLQLLISYGIISAASSGIIERSAYRSIVENYYEHGKLFLSLYLSLSAASLAWISILYSYLLKKFGLKNTFFISSLLIFLSLPLLTSLNIKELYGEKPHVMKTRLSWAQIGKKLLSDFNFLSYVILLFAVCSSRAFVNSQATAIMTDCLEMSSIRAAALSGGLGTIVPVLSRIFFGSYLRNGSLVVLTTGLLASHIAPLVVMMLFPTNKYLFSMAMIVFNSAVGLAHPLGQVFKQSLESIDRKAFNEIQTMVSIAGSMTPILTSWINEKIGNEPSSRAAHLTTIASLLTLNILAGWINLLY